ncbi:MAG: hypothetical protein IJ685_02260 [Selenomonadaceae bacterium]|nr:hypothetical protein [Selenomonadaceae bacterium]
MVTKNLRGLTFTTVFVGALTFLPSTCNFPLEPPVACAAVKKYVGVGED